MTYKDSVCKGFGCKSCKNCVGIFGAHFRGSDSIFMKVKTYTCLDIKNGAQITKFGRDLLKLLALIDVQLQNSDQKNFKINSTLPMLSSKDVTSFCATIEGLFRLKSIETAMNATTSASLKIPAKPKNKWNKKFEEFLDKMALKNCCCSLSSLHLFL